MPCAGKGQLFKQKYDEARGRKLEQARRGKCIVSLRPTPETNLHLQQ